MNEVVNRWCTLAGVLLEQESRATEVVGQDLHVFDFDDTLGVTTSPTLVAAVEYNGGDPDDPTSYTPVKDLGSRVGSKIKGLKSPQQSNLNSPGLSGNNVRSNDELDDAEAIVLDTEQYRDWKEKYIPSGDHIRLVISPNVSSDIRRAGRAMFDQGKTGEIHIADFSPSSTIGTDVKPIEDMLDVFQAAENDGAMTAVVTARKGETDLDALGGGKIPATNASDIQDFLASEIGTNADVVYGAADFNPTDPATAKKDLIGKVHNPNIENIHFYDDDPENARRVAQLCQGDDAEGLEGTELDIYNYEFAKGETPTAPTFSCTIGEENIEESFSKKKKKVAKTGASPALAASGYYGYDMLGPDDYDDYDFYDDRDYFSPIDDYDDHDDYDDYDDGGDWGDFDDGGDLGEGVVLRPIRESRKKPNRIRVSRSQLHKIIREAVRIGVLKK